VRDGEVIIGNRRIRARWIVGADGHNSLVRKWAGLNSGIEFGRRMALRQHFRMTDPPDFVEIHWGPGSQAYLTPISSDQVCVAIISRRTLGSFDSEMQNLPTLCRRLGKATASGSARGGVTVSNQFKNVYRNSIVLIGDASGSVDAITGEGMALGFRQALSLSDALVTGDLSRYARDHRQIAALPHLMRSSMLLLDRNSVLRRRALNAFRADPSLFRRMLSVHVGKLPLSEFGLRPLANFGWRLLVA
jgi:flavin-dependent dehydrogenase